MNDLDKRSLLIASRDAGLAALGLSKIDLVTEDGGIRLEPIVRLLANALVLTAATECRDLDARVSSLVRGYMPPSTNPVARDLRERSDRLTKIIRAIDALSDEKQGAAA